MVYFIPSESNYFLQFALAHPVGEFLEHPFPFYYFFLPASLFKTTS